MSLNPITALSDQLQKLINERGSAAILRDHLAMFKDKIVLLEQKATDLESENAVLKVENEKLKSEAANLRIANNELATKIKEYENPPHKKDLLDEAKVKILVLLSKNDQIHTETIAARCGLSAQAAQFHIEELEKLKMVYGSFYVSAPPTYNLNQEGRRYLIERNML